MKRSTYWDSLKFILIFLVVYTHTLSPYRTDSLFNVAVYNFVYMFHMPLFIFISGRFSHIHDKKNYKNSIFKLLETYLVFQTLFTIISLLSGQRLTIPLLTKPNWVYWYLLSLVLWRLMVYFLPQEWLEKRKTIFISSICVSIVVGYLPIGYHFAIHRTLSFLPFFVMGYYSADLDLKGCINRIPSYIAVGGLVATFAATLATMIGRNAFILHCPYNEWEGIPLLMTTTFPVIRFLFICFVIMLCAMVLRLTPTHAVLARWGENTLFIYIYHTFAIRLLQQLVVKGYLPQNEWLLVIYAILITMALIYLCRFKVFSIIQNPISYYRQSKTKPILNNMKK